MKKYTSEEECNADANLIQDACNPIAVTGTLQAMYKFLVNHGGTEYALAHPSTKAVIGKLASLAHIDHNAMQAYGELSL